jgi:hypothetical protein
MLDDISEWLDATLTDVMYIPGLSRRIFSMMQFAAVGHYTATFCNATTIYFGLMQSPVTLMIHHRGKTLDADLYLHKNYAEYHPIPSAQNQDHFQNKKRISLELLHRRLGHRKCCTLLAASEHNLWNDTTVRMSSKTGISVEVPLLYEPVHVIRMCTPVPVVLASMSFLILYTPKYQRA